MTGRAEGTAREINRLRTAALFVLRPALFGAVVALSFAVPWLALGRAMSGKLVTALLFLFISASLAGLAAEILDRLRAGSPRTPRFAAALLILLLGTVGIFCCLTAEIFIGEHLFEGLPVRIIAIIVVYASAASLYTFLTVGGWLLLPLGMPALAAYAALIARQRR